MTSTLSARANRLSIIDDASPDRAGFGRERTETAVISERQVKWDQEAAMADSKQAELFHTQWNLIREQMSTLSRELVGIRMELKNVKALEGKVADNEQQILRNSNMLAELKDEPRLRAEADDRLQAELRDTYKLISEALNQEIRDRSAGDEEAIRDINTLRSALEKESRDRAVAFDEMSVKMQALVSGLEKEILAREQGDSTLQGRIQDNSQLITNERGERTEGEAAMRRALSGLEASIETQIKDVRRIIDEEAKQRALGDSSLEKALAESARNLEADLEKRVQQLWADTDRTLQQLGSALEREVRDRTSEDETLRQGLQRLTIQSEALKRELTETLKSESTDRIAGDEACMKELKRLVDALSGELKVEIEQRKIGDDDLGRRLADSQREFHMAIQQLRDELGGNMSEFNRQMQDSLRQLEKMDGQFRGMMDDADAARLSGIEDLSRRFVELTRKFEVEIKELRDTFGTGNAEFKNALEQEIRARTEGDRTEAEQRKLVDDELARRQEDLARQLELQIKELRGQLELQIKEMRDMTSEMGMDLRKAIEDLVRQLRDGLEKEARARVEGDEALARQLTEERSARERELAALIKQFQDLIALEKKGLIELINKNQAAIAAVEQSIPPQLNALQAAINDVRTVSETMFADLQKMIENEAEIRLSETVQLAGSCQHARDRIEEESKISRERIETEAKLGRDRLQTEISALERALEELSSRITGDFRLLLEEESKQRALNGASLEKALAELAVNLQAEVDKRAQQLWADTDKSLQQLGSALEREVRDRTSEDEMLRQGLQRLTEQLEPIKRELADMLTVESKERIAGDEACMKELRRLFDALSGELKMEIEQREIGDNDLGRGFNDLQREFQTVIQQLRDELGGKTSDFARQLEEFLRQLENMDRQLRAMMADENAARMAGDEDLSRRFVELARKFEVEIKEVRDTFGTGNTEFKNALEQEIRARTEGDRTEAEQRKVADDELARRQEELARQLELQIKELRDMTSEMGMDLRKAIEDLARQLRDGLEKEARARMEGDEALARQLAEERNARESALAALMKQLQDLIALEKKELLELITKNQAAIAAVEQSIPPQINALQVAIKHLEEASEAMFADLTKMIENEAEIRISETVQLARSCQEARDRIVEEAKVARDRIEKEAQIARDRIEKEAKLSAEQLEAEIAAVRKALQEEDEIRIKDDAFAHQKLVEGIRNLANLV